MVCTGLGQYYVYKHIMYKYYVYAYDMYDYKSLDTYESIENMHTCLLKHRHPLESLMCIL